MTEKCLVSSAEAQFAGNAPVIRAAEQACGKRYFGVC
jgi:hypothetical protein